MLPAWCRRASRRNAAFVLALPAVVALSRCLGRPGCRAFSSPATRAPHSSSPCVALKSAAPERGSAGSTDGAFAMPAAAAVALSMVGMAVASLAAPQKAARGHAGKVWLQATAREAQAVSAVEVAGASVIDSPEVEASASLKPDAGVRRIRKHSAKGGPEAVIPPTPTHYFTVERLVRRMWTAADSLHIHAITGIVHTVVGLLYILDVAAADLAQMNGMKWSEHVPFEVVVASIVFGAANAASGLQPALLPRPFEDVLQLLGIGEKGNLGSAGFVNTAAFFFILTYQSLRVLPSYPVLLQPLDPIFALFSIAALAHTIFIIYSWVWRDKLSQGFAFAMTAPLLLNLPVSLHLLFQGQSWVEQLSAVYPGWPEVFFAANYALAWSGSLVTLVLSLYERKLITIMQRLLMVVAIGALVLSLISLRAIHLIPEWFLPWSDGWVVMFTLIPPSQFPWHSM
mmetsp:Transcript_135982/g.290664  ORF Transcript_135982/g.290664 Transcript_135982/m.290664 type:complete len:456 (+) Transcript_135982:88-1455(+)